MNNKPFRGGPYTTELLGELNKHFSGDIITGPGIEYDTELVDLSFNAFTMSVKSKFTACVEVVIGADRDHHKNVEVSLDDPDCHLQVANDLSEDSETAYEDLITDISVYLTSFENLVFRQMCRPNSAAVLYATLDAYRGKTRDKISVKVQNHHLAQGLGLSTEMFLSTHKALQSKIKTIMEIQNSPEAAEQEAKFSNAIHQLEQVFGLEAPLSVEPVVIKRLFTLAARDNTSKVSPEVGKLLDVVGAKRPVIREGVLSCFGILYERNHKTCLGCGARDACLVEASNLGLNEITIARSVLGTKGSTRIATIPLNGGATQPASRVADEAFESCALSEVDEEILNYLNEHFKKTKHKADTYYKHKDERPDGKLRFIFRVGHDERGRLTLLFCKPGEALNARLVKIKNGSYLPPTTTAAEAIEMIDIHSKETFC